MKKTLPYAGLTMLAAATVVAIVLFPSRKKAATTEIAAKSHQADAGAFVGAETCGKCHAQQYGVWQHSTHSQAGGKPGSMDMIAPFDAQPLRFKDAVVIPTTNAQGHYLFVVQLEGAPQFEVKVDAVVGGGHMYGGGTQSFFNEYPDGTWRFLPFDFSRQGNIWFTQSRKDKTWVPIAPELSLQTDALNWPPSRVLGTSVEFSNCQNCHGSQITLGYDATQRKHQTHFQTLKIN